MAEKTVFLTKEGKEKQEKRLEYLKTVKRPEISEHIRTAREFGDISENAEYENAKRDQAYVEGEIAEIEKTLKNCQIIDKSSINTDEVGMGSIVTLLDIAANEEFTFEIVGTRESNPTGGRISNVSPLGAAILGKGKGEIVDVRTSTQASAKWEILDIRST